MHCHSCNHLTSIALIGVAVALTQPAHPASPSKAEIHIGIDQGDLRGNDNRALQAAMDYAASLGGGTVVIGPGRYTMRNALILRSGVNVRGAGDETLLLACDGVETSLAADGDCNERQITLKDPDAFRVGDGVSIQDGRKGGFEVTTATLTEKIGTDTFRISAPLYLDYMVSDKATARLVFPIVGGWNVTNVLVEGLTLDGNRAHAQPLNGCRGGGIFLFESEGVTLRRCTVRNYNGDGISFQVSQHVVVEDCLSENNAGLGLHPGSGSQHPVVRRNRSFDNGGDGLYVCWRVKYGLFESNELRGNRGYGVSIGHKDSDNLFRQNKIVENARAGVIFRNESEAMGAHRNVFENNVIVDNGLAPDGRLTGGPVEIHGVHRDVQFRQNTIGYSKPVTEKASAILTNPSATGLRAEGNHLENLQREVAQETR